jgi:hypothetical protein
MQSFKTLTVVILLSSCSVYKTKFDSPASMGVQGKSVTEIEEMIIETKEGPDLFMVEERTCACIQNNAKKAANRIWVEETISASGVKVEGHYVYFEEEEAD